MITPLTTTATLPPVSGAQTIIPNSANLVNYRVGPAAAIPGSYAGTVYTESAAGAGVTGFNQVMMQMAEHWDPFLQKKLIEQPSFWYNRIPRGSFPNFMGTEHETRIFRGGLVEYAGLGKWAQIDPMPTVSNNPCKLGSYDTPSYTWDRLTWNGFYRYWGSDPICLNSLRYVDQAVTQLAWILEASSDYGISIQEVWNRDWLIRTSVEMGRSYVMTSSYVGNSSAPRFYYEPRCTFPTSAVYAAATDKTLMVDPATGVTGPFIVFPAGIDVEPLNFDVLDALHESLDVRARGQQIGNDSGRPLFGLPVSALDFERYVRGNDYELANWREARAEKLITGYDLGVKTHRAWGILNDGNQLRFKIVKYVISYDSDDYGGTGGDLDGKAVIVAQYVAPRIADSTCRIGENGQPVPEDNPEYISAELAVMPIMMNDIFTNLMGTELNSLGSSTYFGPQAGLNGKLSWVNILSENNPEGLTGNFRGKWEIFPKKENGIVNSTSFLYRRCTQSIRSRCPVDNADVDPDAQTGAVAAVGYAAVSTDVGVSAVITATLAGKVSDCGPGTAVTVVFTEGTGAAGATFTGYVLRSDSAPKYTIQLNSASFVADTDGVATDDGYHINADGTLSQFTTDTSTALAISTVTKIA